MIKKSLVFVSLLLLLADCTKVYYNDLELTEPLGFEPHEQLFVSRDESLPGLLYSTSDGEKRLELYGLFGDNGFPKQINSMVIHQVNSDTSQVFKIGMSNTIEYSYRTYNGEKENIMVLFDHSREDTTYVQAYQFDWESNSGEFLYEVPVPLSAKKTVSSEEFLLQGDCLDDMRGCINDIFREHNETIGKIGDIGFSVFGANVVSAAFVIGFGATLPASATIAAVVGGVGLASYALSKLSSWGTPTFKSSPVLSCHQADYPKTPYLDAECGLYQSCKEQSLYKQYESLSLFTYEVEMKDLYGEYISDEFYASGEELNCGFLAPGVNRKQIIIDQSSIFIEDFCPVIMPLKFTDSYSTFGNYNYYDFEFGIQHEGRYYSGLGTLKSGRMIEFLHFSISSCGFRTLQIMVARKVD